MTVIPLLSEGIYSFTTMTEKVKRTIAHKVRPLPQCNLWDCTTDFNVHSFRLSGLVPYLLRLSSTHC